MSDGATRDECISFAEKLTGMFSEIIAQSMTSQLIDELDDRDVTLSQLHALTWIAEHSPCSVGALAHGLKVTHPAAVRLVEKLARRSLVLKGTAPGDHRQAALRPTETGLRLARTARRERVRRLERVLDRMDPAARQGLIQGLQEFVAAALQSGEAVDQLCVSCQALKPEPCDMFPLLGRLEPAPAAKSTKTALGRVTTARG